MSADERKFLHDLANPLATAIFVLEMAIEDSDATVADQLKQVKLSLEKAKVILQERQALLRLKTGD